MNCRSAFAVSLAALGLVSSTYGQLGPRTYFHADVQAEAAYDSAVFGRSDSPDDTIFSIRPAVSYERTSGVIHAVARVGVQINRFAEFEDENSEDLKSSLVISGPNSPDQRVFLEARASYNEFNEISSKIGGRIHGQDADVRGLARYVFSDRITGVATGRFRSTNVTDANFIGNRSYEAALEAFYQYRRDWQLLAGYRLRSTTIEDFTPEEFPELVNDEELDTQDHAVYVGARNALNKKLELTGRLGWQQRSFDEVERNGIWYRRSDNDSLFFEVQAQWQAREDLQLTFAALQDFNTTVDNRSNDETSFSVELVKTWTPRIESLSFVGYDIYRFRSPNDSESEENVLLLRQGLNYTLWDDGRAFAEVAWMDRDSDLAATNYQRHTLRLGFFQRF